MSDFAEFLGVGLVAPLQRDASDFASSSGEDLVRACVEQILGTRAGDGDSPGDLEWENDFGSKLHKMLFRKGKILDELARVYVVDSLKRWEPRVQVSIVQTMWAPSERRFAIRLRYNVIDRNKPGNNVIFRDVEQDVLLPYQVPQAA